MPSRHHDDPLQTWIAAPTELLPPKIAPSSGWETPAHQMRRGLVLHSRGKLRLDSWGQMGSFSPLGALWAGGGFVLARADLFGDMLLGEDHACARSMRIGPFLDARFVIVGWLLEKAQELATKYMNDAMFDAVIVAQDGLAGKQPDWLEQIKACFDAESSARGPGNKDERVWVEAVRCAIDFARGIELDAANEALLKRLFACLVWLGMESSSDDSIMADNDAFVAMCSALDVTIENTGADQL